MNQEDLEAINEENRKILAALSIDSERVNGKIQRILDRWGYESTQHFLNEQDEALLDAQLELMNLLRIIEKTQPINEGNVTLEDIIELKMKRASLLTEMVASYRNSNL